jgi:hypothetical protein
VEEDKCRQEFLKKPEGKSPLEIPGRRREVNMRIDLKILKANVMARHGLDSSSSGEDPVAGCLVTVTKIGFHKMRGISLLADLLVAFQAGLWFTRPVS